jgi:hypothetical protein
MNIIVILILAVLPIVFMFAVDYRLSKIYKELRILNATMMEQPAVGWRLGKILEELRMLKSSISTAVDNTPAEVFMHKGR